MKTFRFRLKRLLEVRRLQEKVVARRFAEASERHQRELAKLGQLEEAYREAQRALREGVQDGSAAPGRVAIRSIEAALPPQRDRVRQSEAALAAHRRELVEVRQEVEALESLEARARAEHRREVGRMREKAMDERHLMSMVNRQKRKERDRESP